MDEASGALAAGRVVVMPTDTVYGVMASIRHPSAIARIFEIKQRPLDKPLAVLVPSLHDALHLAWFTKDALDEVEMAWPGALTVVVERTPETMSLNLGGDGETIGIRHPDDDFLIEVMKRAGPLAATSANRSGEVSGVTVEEIAGDLGDGVDLYVDGGRISGEPSKVISYVGEKKQLR